MANEPIQGLPYPDLTGVPPNVPADIKALADAVAPRSVMRFASIAARDAALPTPVDGMVCYIAADNGYYARVGGQWRVLWSPDRVTTVEGIGGMGGAFTAVRRGWTVSLVGGLTGNPTDPQGSTVAQIPLGFRPAAAFKVVLGSSGVASSNRNVRLVGFTAGGEVHLAWSGSFGDGTPGSGGSNLHVTGVTYETADD